jgi:hypothetical protein
MIIFEANYDQAPRLLLPYVDKFWQRFSITWIYFWNEVLGKQIEIIYVSSRVIK